MYNTDPSVDVILLGADGNDRVFAGAGVVPPEIWDQAKDAFDKLHDPDYVAGRDTSIISRGTPSKNPTKKKATKKAGRLT